MLKKARVMHDARGFFLTNWETQEYIASIDPGNIEDDIDWDYIDEQAKDLGYRVEQSDCKI